MWGASLPMITMPPRVGSEMFMTILAWSGGKGGWPGPVGRSPKRLMGPMNSVLNTDL